MGPVETRLRAFYDDEMAERAGRALPPERIRRRDAFAAECRRRGLVQVLEIGCGAGRDGRVLSADLRYVGIDLSLAAAGICATLGAGAAQALATRLPFRDGSFDAAWSMSTLMHLPGDGMDEALGEVARVVRPGGLVEVGVWGATEDREHVDEKGRYFCQRSDATLRRLLSTVGTVEDFSTWDWFPDGGHYQWARVSLDPSRHAAGGPPSRRMPRVSTR